LEVDQSRTAQECEESAISTDAEFFGVSDVVLRQASCSDLARFRGYSSGQYGEARGLLGWKPKEVEESILDTVDSLIKYGLV
jgi:hypothetical protein